MMDAIRADLHMLGIKHDVYFSEASLVNAELVQIQRNYVFSAKFRNQFVDDILKNYFELAHQLAVNSLPEVSHLRDHLDSRSASVPRQIAYNILYKSFSSYEYIFKSMKNRTFLYKIRHAVIHEFIDLEIKGPNEIDFALVDLRLKDLIYEGRLPPPKGQKDEDWEDREQTLFRSTQFGDDVDRPLLKSDGGYTYFASDIAYHKSKFDRGFPEMIDVWGADHGGYVKRMQAAVKAVTGGKGSLDVKLIQLVKLMRNGEPVKMSKRSGEFITLRDVIDELTERGGHPLAGRDAIRFMMLFRKNDAPLEFDLAKVLEQSKDNPVFYVQYAHARCASVFRQAQEAMPGVGAQENLAAADLSLLQDDSERALMRLLAQYPRVVEQAAAQHEPHRVAFFLYDLAAELHALWNKGKDSPQLRFVNQTDRNSTSARLSLVLAVKVVLASGLGILGVSSPEEMR